MKVAKRLTINTAVNMACLVINGIVGFFLVPFFLGSLNAGRYGIWVLIASIFQYRFILTGGLNSAINRYIPVCLATKDKAQLSKVVTTSFIYYLFLGAILLILSTLVSYNFSSIFPKIDADLAAVGARLILIVGIFFSIALPFQITNAILSGMQCYHISGGIQLICILCRTVLAVILLNMEMMLHGLKRLMVTVLH